MKKAFLISFLFTVTLSTVLAQSKPWQVGIQVGIGLNSQSNNSGDINNPPAFRIGYESGLAVAHTFKEGLTLQTGLLYDIRGLSYKSSSGYTSYQYLSVPLMLRKELGNLKATHFYIEGGSYVAYLLAITTSQGASYPLTDITRFNAALSAGAGVCFGKFNIGIRGKYDLTSYGNLNVRNYDIHVHSSVYF